MKCCRCGKSFYDCKAMHPIDPPGTENRRWVCLDCETAEENAVVRDCRECHYYKGCEDCALCGTEYCDKNKIMEERRIGKNEDV